MPIEARIMLDGDDDPAVEEEVLPDDRSIMVSYGDNRKKKYLSVGCYVSDFGGTLHEFSEEDVVVREDGTSIPVSLFDKAHERGEVRFGSAIEYPVMDEDGNRATLVIKHVGKHATLMFRN